MYVCLCKGVTSDQINREIDAGANCVEQLKERLDVANQCGSCSCEVQAIVNSRNTPSATLLTSTVSPTIARK